jgi:hypothetical protein
MGISVQFEFTPALSHVDGHLEVAVSELAPAIEPRQVSASKYPEPGRVRNACGQPHLQQAQRIATSGPGNLHDIYIGVATRHCIR